MSWLLVRVGRVPMLSHGLNCADIVVAISPIAQCEVLNRHIYNTAMNSIEKDKRPGLEIWDPTSASDLRHGVWMNKFVSRSGQYHHPHDSSSMQNLLICAFSSNPHVLISHHRPNLPVWTAWNQGASSTGACIGLPTWCLPRSRSSQAYLRPPEAGGAFRQNQVAGEVRERSCPRIGSAVGVRSADLV